MGLISKRTSFGIDKKKKNEIYMPKVSSAKILRLKKLKKFPLSFYKSTKWETTISQIAGFFYNFIYTIFKYAIV